VRELTPELWDSLEFTDADAQEMVRDVVGLAFDRGYSRAVLTPLSGSVLVTVFDSTGHGMQWIVHDRDRWTAVWMVATEDEEALFTARDQLQNHMTPAATDTERTAVQRLFDGTYNRAAGSSTGGLILGNRTYDVIVVVSATGEGKVRFPDVRAYPTYERRDTEGDGPAVVRAQADPPDGRAGSAMIVAEFARRRSGLVTRVGIVPADVFDMAYTAAGDFPARQEYAGTRQNEPGFPLLAVDEWLSITDPDSDISPAPAVSESVPGPAVDDIDAASEAMTEAGRLLRHPVAGYRSDRSST
jgi:hypothetical protein